MLENKDTVSERIKILFEHFGNGNLSAFARELNVSAQAIRDLMKGEKGGPSWPVLQNILRTYPSISTDWLVLGQGKMLRQSVVSIDTPDMSPSDLESVKKHVADIYNAHMKAEIDASLKEMDEKLKTVTDKAIQARIDQDATSIVYSIVGKPNPKRPYDGLLSVRLGITDEEARQLVEDGQLEAWYIGNSQRVTNWRTNELNVRHFLNNASRELVKPVA